MRVVIDGRKIADYGIGTYIRGLLRGLQELGGHDEYIVLAPESARELIPFEHVVSEAPKYSLREIVAIGAAVRRLRADVFHAPHYVIPVTSTPTVVTIHDLIHLHLSNPVKRAYAWTMLRRAAKQTVVTVTGAMKQEIESTLGAREVIVTPNGVDPRFTPDGRRSPGEYFLFVGNDKPHKNVATLVAAYERAKPSAGLVLAGAEFSRFRSRVTLPGFVDDDELAALYRGALALVIPSIEEGFGLPAVEAMACGTAVITSNAPALVEITGDAALHVDARDAGAIADAMIRIANDGTLRADLASRGIARARQFTWRTCAERTREAYERAVSRES
ncbi:MAG TPA: glycosyltransferase family 1 protein [Thermoanaerobaculia bacterium]|jgi:glycosyltransferase involved in cell wall biosynthesis